MRAIVFSRPGDFSLTEVPDPVPGPRDLVVRVEAVGDEVTAFAPGDRISVDLSLYCGECAFCSIGRANLCENWNGAGALQAATMVSHAFSLDDYGDAVELFRAGTGRKLRIRPKATQSIAQLSRPGGKSERAL